MPEELYLIPINNFLQVQIKASLLSKYKRGVVSKFFDIEEFC